MIVTTGKRIKIEIQRYTFERDCETPGHVTVTRHEPGGRIVMSLPNNDQERRAFIVAYERACAEEIDYRKSECE